MGSVRSTLLSPAACFTNFLILVCLTAGGLCGFASLSPPWRMRPPRRIFFLLAKPACLQAGLLIRRGGYSFFLFLSQRHRVAKKLWCARFDFPPRRTGFASLSPPWRMRPPRRIFFLLAKAPRRKEIVVHSYPPRRTGLSGIILTFSFLPVFRRLCGFASLRAIFFFFSRSLPAADGPACRRQATSLLSNAQR